MAQLIHIAKIVIGRMTACQRHRLVLFVARAALVYVARRGDVKIIG
ncbi:MAG: hypothetical protein GY938_29530 [Ketobacter sp.]|nr:hypothetical protein [Ketobacter sp.]